jgi:hypothetical protein
MIFPAVRRDRKIAIAIEITVPLFSRISAGNAYQLGPRMIDQNAEAGYLIDQLSKTMTALVK